MLIDLRQALARFEKFAAEDALVFRVRYFMGCTFAEVADLLDMSETSAKEAWQRSCAWLQRELKAYGEEQAP
ncbi:MAG: hypothetical protein HYR84_06640 [Planctomycetes bacterium]|nr:hypothetical protein [Planctomycetota bacterium]